MKNFKTQEELIEWVYTMHLQNTNGREKPDEIFKLGIEACLDELSELKLFAIPVVVLPKGTLCACGLTADGTLYSKPMCEGCLHRNT